MTNYPQDLRVALTKKKGWWEHKFFFWRMLSGLRFLEEIIKSINYEKTKYQHMKTTIRNFLFRSGKVFYSLAVKSGENKNYKLEKFFYVLSKSAFEARWILYGF